MQSFLLITLLVSLAGRALAFTNVTLGATFPNTLDLLTIPDGPVKAACTSTCDPARTTLQNCNGDSNCQCTDDTVNQFVKCQQCWFTEVIKENVKMPNIYAGSTPAIQAFVTACGQPPTNRTFPKTQTGLTLPADWDGPVGIDLGLGGTVVGVISATILGVGAMLTLSNL